MNGNEHKVVPISSHTLSSVVKEEPFAEARSAANYSLVIKGGITKS